MKVDVLSAVEEAESAAAKIKSDAKLEAAYIIAKAEADGKQTVEEAGNKAAQHVENIFADLDKQANNAIASVVTETAKVQKDLADAADAHMADAVELIKERIVKG